MIGGEARSQVVPALPAGTDHTDALVAARRWDFFISHSGADDPVVETFYDRLVELGLRVYWDRRNLNRCSAGGVAGEVEDALNASNRMILVWSADAAKAPWVLNEARGFAARAPDSQSIVIVRVDAEPLPVELGARAEVDSDDPEHVVEATARAYLGGIDVWVDAAAERRSEAERLAEVLERSGIAARVFGKHPPSESDARRWAERVERPTIILVGDGPESTTAWKWFLEMDRGDPDDLLFVGDAAGVPRVLAHCRRLPSTAVDDIVQWAVSHVQRVRPLWRAFLFGPHWWRQRARSIRPRLVPWFAIVDLQPADWSNRRALAVLGIVALALLPSAVLDGLWIGASYALPLLDEAVTRRHLVMSLAAAWVFGGLLIVGRSVAAGCAASVAGGFLGGALTLATGMLHRAGGPGGAATIGAALGASAAVYANLDKRRRVPARGHEIRAVVALAAGSLAVLVMFAVGGAAVYAFNLAFGAPKALELGMVLGIVALGSGIGALIGLGLARTAFATSEGHLRAKDRPGHRRIVWWVAATTGLACALVGVVGALVSASETASLGNGYFVGCFIGGAAASAFGLIHVLLARAGIPQHRAAPWTAAATVALIAILLPFFTGVRAKAALSVSVVIATASGYALLRFLERIERGLENQPDLRLARSKRVVLASVLMFLVRPERAVTRDLVLTQAQLDAAVAAVDDELPNDLRDDVPAKKGFRVEYSVHRDPIRATLSGNTVKISTVAHYSVRVHEQFVWPIGWKAVFSCGHGGDRLRRSRVEAQGEVSISPEGHPKLRFVGASVHPIDRCEGGPFGIHLVDATDRISTRARQILEDAGRRLERVVARL